MNVFIESRGKHASSMQVASVRKFVRDASQVNVTAYVQPFFSEADIRSVIASSPAGEPGLFLSNGVVAADDVFPFNGIARVASSFRPLVVAWTDKSLLTFFDTPESPFTCDFETLQQEAISPECGRLRKLGGRFLTANSALGIPVKAERECWQSFASLGNTDWQERDECRAGTHLKRLLAGPPFFFREAAGCACSDHARKMDAWGCDECERRREEIVGWLRTEASRRGLPFFDAAGRALVRLAIARARKNSR